MPITSSWIPVWQQGRSHDLVLQRNLSWRWRQRGPVQRIVPNRRTVPLWYNSPGAPRSGRESVNAVCDAVHIRASGFTLRHTRGGLLLTEVCHEPFDAFWIHCSRHSCRRDHHVAVALALGPSRHRDNRSGVTAATFLFDRREQAPDRGVRGYVDGLLAPAETLTATIDLTQSAALLLPGAGDQHQQERGCGHQRADRGDGRVDLVAQRGEHPLCQRLILAA